MRRRLFCLFAMVFVTGGVRDALAQPLVAESPALSPAEQLPKFHLPPGFSIQLVACEPDVNKPMNMKFDSHGRLWVTHSLEYPFAAKDDAQARDAITVFSDFAPDGRARKVQRFAEHLNIPIGVLPLADHEAIVWSIPNIFRLTDTDGDGVADRKVTAFGPFGIIDTHGNQNSFTRWVDGWVYANHGFNNDSRVKIGGEGDEALHMQSGNTYRFRLDGSAIEQYAWGQVNPFGLSFDPLGNLFSADCHSRPVTMLQREGFYQSFGKPHDGLGFAPETTTLDHGGTGIAGVVYNTLPDFPPEYRDVLFVGNVITNRVHCDRLKWTGSSPVVEKIEDFLTCDDPWFRPVDLQAGPDGALYVADFYNCIIGHYEVPLTHPKRDRERGRIWRIVYTGQATDPPAKTNPTTPTAPDLAKTTANKLLALLGHDNLTLRMLATNQLIDRFGKEAGALARQKLQANPQPASEGRQIDRAAQFAHALWVVARTEGLDAALARRLADDPDRLVRVHLLNALSETGDWQAWHVEIARSKLTDVDPFVRRAAAGALARHPAAENIVPLLALLGSTDAGDAQLVHAVRISLRDQLRSPAVAENLLTLKLTPEQSKQLIEFAASAPTGPAALLIFDEALRGNVRDELLVKALPAAARYVDAPRVDAMVEFVHKRFAGNADQQMLLLRGLGEGLVQRGLPLTDRLRTTLTDAIKAALAGDTSSVWANHPLPSGPVTKSPWVPQPRRYQDGDNSIPMISSLPVGGERLGGILRSPLFNLPPKLSFWMCGHNGLPDKPDRKLNYARLVLADGTEAARSYPPRSDLAQRFEWDLKSHTGQRGYVEIVDGLTDLDGFAWLAVSRFEPAVIRVPDYQVGEAGRSEWFRIAGQLKLTALTEEIFTATGPANTHLNERLTATDALVMLAPDRAIAPLAAILADTNLPTPTREQAAQQLGRIDRNEARTVLLAQLKTAPETVSVLLAAAVAGKPESAAALLQEIRAGRAAAALLREPTVVDRLKAAKLPDLEKQIAELTAHLTPADDRIAKLIAQRKSNFLAGQFDAEAGRAVFAKSVCANCHRIGAVGKTIGPALDGIGARGLDRLLEDTLDPNRNVDAAFRTMIIETEGGQILTGFGLREEGQTLVLNDSKGEPIRIPLAEVAQRKQSALSPMPANTIEQMPERDFFQLLTFLLSQKTK